MRLTSGVEVRLSGDQSCGARDRDLLREFARAAAGSVALVAADLFAALVQDRCGDGDALAPAVAFSDARLRRDQRLVRATTGVVTVTPHGAMCTGP